MANLGELTAVLTANTQPLRDGLRQTERAVEQSSNRMVNSMQQFNQSMQRAGDRMMKVGKTMSMYVTAPLTGFGVLALRTAGEFESSMKRVEAISQGTADEMEALETQARELGETTMFSASEAADAMSYLAMAGFEVNEMMGAMPATLDLAAAGQMELGQSADIVSDVMQGFAMDTEETEHVVDVLSKAFTTANTTLHGLGEAMSFAAPVAHTYGVAIEEATAAVGFLSDAGIKAGRAGTSLRQVMLRLADQADDLGLNIRDSEGNLKDLADVLEEVENSGLQTSEIVESLGSQAGPAFATLIERGSEELREYTAQLEDSGGTAEEVADKQMEGLQGALKELRSAFEGLQIAIAEAGLLEFAADLVEKVTGLIRRVSDWNQTTLKTITIIGSLAAAMAPLLVSLGIFAKTAVPAAIGIVKTFKAVVVGVTGAVRAFNTALATTPMGAFVGISGAAIAAWWGIQRAVYSTTEAQKALNRVQDQISGRFDQQAAEIDRLTRVVEDGNIPLNERREAVERLNELVPEYNAQLTEQGELIDHNTDALDKHLDRLKEEIILEAFREEITEAIRRQRDALRELEKAQDEAIDTQMRSHGAMERSNHVMDDTNSRMRQGTWEVNQARQALEEAEQTVEALENEYQQYLETLTFTNEATEEQTEKQEEDNEKKEEGARLVDRYTASLQALQITQRSGIEIMDEMMESVDRELEKLDKVSREYEDMVDIYERYRGQMVQAEEMNDLFGDSYDMVEEKMRATRRAIERLTEEYGAQSPMVQHLMDQYEELEKKMDDTSDGIANTERLARMAGSAFAGMANQIGQAAAGAEASVEDMVSSMIDSMQQAINMMFAEAAAKLLLEGATQGLGGLALAAAGIGALKAMWQRHVNPDAAPEPQGLARGGDVTREGVFQVGERGVEDVYLPRGAAVRPVPSDTKGGGYIASTKIDMGELWIMLKEQEAHNDRNYGS